MIRQCVRCPSWFCIEPMQKSLCRNALWRENQLSCVPAFPHPMSKLGLRPTEEREGKNCLGKIKRKRKEGRKERREGGRDGKVLMEALTLYRANPIPETKCTRTSMPRWLLVSEHSLWPQTFSLLEKTQEGCSLHGIRGQRLTESRVISLLQTATFTYRFQKHPPAKLKGVKTRVRLQLGTRIPVALSTDPGFRTGYSLIARLISSTYLHPINQVKEFASTYELPSSHYEFVHEIWKESRRFLPRARRRALCGVCTSPLCHWLSTGGSWQTWSFGRKWAIPLFYFFF